MAALSAARNTPARDPGGLRSFPVGNDIVYAGGLVSMLVSGGTGVILAGQDTDNHRCMGIALETVDGTGGDSPQCEVYTEGTFLLDATSPATSWVGAVAHISDDQTVVISGTSNTIIVGIIEEVDTTNSKAWVRLNPYHVTA